MTDKDQTEESAPPVSKSGTLSRRGKIIALAVAAALVIGGGAAAFAISTHNSKQAEIAEEKVETAKRIAEEQKEQRQLEDAKQRLAEAIEDGRSLLKTGEIDKKTATSMKNLIGEAEQALESAEFSDIKQIDLLSENVDDAVAKAKDAVLKSAHNDLADAIKSGKKAAKEKDAKKKLRTELQDAIKSGEKLKGSENLEAIKKATKSIKAATKKVNDSAKKQKAKKDEAPKQQSSTSPGSSQGTATTPSTGSSSTGTSQGSSSSSGQGSTNPSQGSSQPSKGGSSKPTQPSKPSPKPTQPSKPSPKPTQPSKPSPKPTPKPTPPPGPSALDRANAAAAVGNVAYNSSTCSAVGSQSGDGGWNPVPWAQSQVAKYGYVAFTVSGDAKWATVTAHSCLKR